MDHGLFFERLYSDRQHQYRRGRNNINHNHLYNNYKLLIQFHTYSYQTLPCRQSFSLAISVYHCLSCCHIFGDLFRQIRFHFVQLGRLDQRRAASGHSKCCRTLAVNENQICCPARDWYVVHGKLDLDPIHSQKSKLVKVKHVQNNIQQEKPQMGSRNH